MPCNESWIYCYDPTIKRQGSQWKHAGSPRPKKARQSKSTHKLLMISFFWQHWHDLHALSSHWTDSQQGIICWGFKGVQEEIPSEEASTLQIESVSFPPGQCTSPQLHPCHRLFDQDGHQDSSSPSQLSRPWAPLTFAYSLNSRKTLEAVVMRQLRRWKRLWQRSLTGSHKRTSMGPSRSCWNGTSALQPEEITSKGTRVSCVYYQSKCPYEKIWKLIEGTLYMTTIWSNIT